MFDEECVRKYICYESYIYFCVGKGILSSFVVCYGDSGGFFVCEMGGIWYFYGVVSFGKKNCLSIYYIVFVCIMSYFFWIMEKIGK